MLSELETNNFRYPEPVPVLLWKANLDKSFFGFNQGWLDFTGRTLEQEAGLGWLDNVHPDDAEKFMRIFTQNFDNQIPFSVEYRLKRHDQKYRWVVNNGVPIIDETGLFSGYLGSCIDITTQKENEEKLIKNKKVLQTLAKTSASEDGSIFELIVEQLASSQSASYALIAIIAPDDKNKIRTIAVWGNGSLLDNFTYSLKGTPCDKVLGTDACFYPESVQHLFPEDTLLAEMDAESYIGVPLKCSKGTSVGILAILDTKPLQKEEHYLELLNTLATRVSIELERLKVEDTLKISAQLFSQTKEGILITDINSRIIDVNPAFIEITGYSREDVLGKNPRILRSGRQSPSFYESMWISINESGYWQGEVWNRKKDGELYAENLSISVLKNERGENTHYVGIFSDITQSKQQQEKLRLIAHYDVLTGLPNRSLLVDRFNQAIVHAKRVKNLMAICFLDLDNFKPVNDNYGHETGDKLLIEVANRITREIREEDTVSRYGGDEFALILRDINDLKSCQNTLSRILKSLNETFFISNNAIYISASIGVAIYPDNDDDIDTLMRLADQAMYTAKMSGKNQINFFSPSDSKQQKKRQKQFENIKKALRNHEFKLFYQPKVNMRTGEVFGAEALIRWIDPEKGIIPPLEFLPLLQGTDLEIEIGQWVINQALSQLSDWNQQGIHLELSVNVSSYHLLSEDFLLSLENELALYPDITSHNLQLEILESSALSDLNKISQVIETCQKKLNVRIALDDFGTGYSSLAHLRTLNVDTIKIDQSFVSDILNDASDHVIIDGVISLAEAFDNEIIAEGVENTEQGLMLLAMGCDRVQGYGIARPMPTHKFVEWLGNYKPNLAWLNNCKEKCSPLQNKLKQIRLAIEQWKNEAITNAAADVSPLCLNHEKCLCGSLIDRAFKDQHFLDDSISELYRQHQELHLIAQNIHAMQSQGSGQNISPELNRLEKTCDNMSKILNELKTL